MAMINGASTPGFEGKGTLGGILKNYKASVYNYNSLCASNDFAMKMILDAKNKDRELLENKAPEGHLDIDS